MSVKDILSRGFRELRRKNDIRKLQKELNEQREHLAKLYEEIGKTIKEIDRSDPYLSELVRSMKNVFEMINNLKKENNDFMEKIDLKKEEYDQRVEEYNPLIESLKENMIEPKNNIITNKENLENLKIELRDLRNNLKNKEKIFKNNEEIMAQENEEHILNEEKNKALQEEQNRVQKEILELTQNFEMKTEESERVKEEINIIENEIKTAESQISTYKKEMVRLKKEKNREIDTLKRLIMNNSSSIQMREKELKHIFMNLGSLAYEKRVLGEDLGEHYQKVDDVQARVKQISEDRHFNAVQSEKEDKFILIKFFALMLLFIGVTFGSIYFIYHISSGSSSSIDYNDIEQIDNDGKKGFKFSPSSAILTNDKCGRATIRVKVDPKKHHSVKSGSFLNKTKLDGDNLYIEMIYDGDTTNLKPKKLELFEDQKLLHVFILTLKYNDPKQKKCLQFKISR